jgi:hypothetical protein
MGGIIFLFRNASIEASRHLKLAGVGREGGVKFR